MSLANGQLKSKFGYLPTEVLSAIFQECLELDEFDCTTPSPLRAPLVLTWVCRFWRTIALNTHCLWAGVVLVREASRVDDSTRLLELWIERSGALPFGVRFANVMREGGLVLSLTGRPDDDDSPQMKGIQNFIETVLKCHKRWRVLEVAIPEISFAAPLLRTMTEGARGLERLSISLQYLGLNDEPTTYDFSHNRALQSVRLVTPLVLPLPTGNNEIFTNLNLLELSFCASVQDVLSWIDMAPNLTHLIVRLFITGSRRVPLEARHVRRLPFLVSLELTCFATNIEAEDPGLLLDLLEVPKLTDLEIELAHLFDSEEWPHVRNLLTRSEASLLMLSISGTPMSDRDVVECLRLSPELESLVCEIVTDGILTALTPRRITDDPAASSTGLPPLTSAGENMETDLAPGVDNPTNSAQTGGTTDPNPLDPSRYTVLCPNLEFFEASDVDGCSLEALYSMMNSRCDEIYEDIRGHVDTSAFPPAPEEFKTLQSIVLPCDPLFSTLSHPQILEGLERTVYF